MAVPLTFDGGSDSGSANQISAIPLAVALIVSAVASASTFKQKPYCMTNIDSANIHLCI